jgi:hypothetical protein
VVFAGALLFAIRVFTLPFSAYLKHLNIDDSFYYYKIARNLAMGRFSTFDGIHVTNGYHPLWALLLTPIFAVLHDPILALRAAKMLELALLLLAALLIMAGGRKAGWSPIVAMAVPVALFGAPVLYLGMETSIQALLFAALMCGLVRRALGPDRLASFLIIAVCCLLPWARLETLSISIAAMAAASLFSIWTDRRHFRTIAAGWALLGLSLAAYFLYNQSVFESPIPVSGAIKNYWSSGRFAAAGGYDLVANAKPYLRVHRALIGVSAFTALIALASWTVRNYRASRGMEANKAIDLFVLLMAIGYAARLVYSILFVHYAYDNLYYYVPAYILAALAAPYSLSRLLLLAQMLAPPWRAHALASGVAGGAALLAVALQAHPWSLPALWQAPGSPANWLEASFVGASWINRNLPSGAVVGSPDSGVLGYFSDRRVVNLDGLVNTKDFFAAIKTQSVESWMRREGVTHLANAVRTDVADGCAWIAAGSLQTRPYSACRPLYQGVLFREAWLGKTDEMQFRVYSFGAGSGT